MKNDSNIIFYLGYHKTASKWIWNNYFKAHYNCHQIGRRSTQEVRQIINTKKGNPPIVLRERVEDGLMGADFPELAQKLAEIAPGAKVVTGIRSQRSMLASHYGQYVANGGRLGFNAYMQEAIATKWHYHPTLKELMEVFDGRVFVYLFEELRNDSLDLVRRLRDFVGPPATGIDDAELRSIANLPPMNPQRHDLVLDTMLLLNRLRMRHENNAIIPPIKRAGADHILVEAAEGIAKVYARGFGRPLRYRKFDDRGALDHAYADENAALSELLGRPLRAHGYPG